MTAEEKAAIRICRSIDALTKEMKRMRMEVKNAQGKEIEIETEIEVEDMGEDEDGC